MKRWLIFLYGVTCYALFHAVFIYSVLFIGNFFNGNLFLGPSLDGLPRMDFALGLSINLGLLTLFAIQHSGMARPAFKKWLTRFIPESAERSTYVLLSNLAMIALFIFWQPLGGPIWEVGNPVLRAAIYGVFFLGWAIVLFSTFAICHFDLLGLRQVWLQLRGKPYVHHEFRTPTAYKLVRHPLYVGWILVFWAAPSMTLAHLVFAVTTTVYILIAIQLEERDLIGVFGNKYSEYKKRVPMLIPIPRFKAESKQVNVSEESVAS